MLYDVGRQALLKGLTGNSTKKYHVYTDVKYDKAGDFTPT